jgi:hypothetical protein
MTGTKPERHAFKGVPEGVCIKSPHQLSGTHARKSGRGFWKLLEDAGK